MSFKVNYLFKEHEIGKDFWLNKKHLIDSFFGDFYDFIFTHGGKDDLLAKEIHNRQEFIAFADWYADGKENCYGIGFAFYKYYLTVDDGGKIENQPQDTFIGYCYHNGKYLDFLNFLITFFAWWRNDEHCTNFNPYNHADDFFGSSWAVLVDTSKLFYFTGETVFGWQSYRVKYACDNIPGTILTPYQQTITYDNAITLPRIRVAGYEFLGWYDDKGNKIEKCAKDMMVYADFKRKDIYDYWEKEEKTINKVYTPTYKKVDPA